MITDDILIIENKEKNRKIMVEKLKSYLKKKKLILNIEKIKMIIFKKKRNKKNHQVLKMKKIEIIKEFIYLDF